MLLTNRLYIDGKDAYTEYGVIIKDDTLAPLVAMPSLKTIATNNWGDEDGIEADLSNPILNARSIALTFHLFRIGEATTLLQDLTASLYHTFRFVNLDRTFTLRYLSHSNVSTIGLSYAAITINFQQDSVAIPSASRYLVLDDSTIPESQHTGYRLDGTDLAIYGIKVLQGTNNTLLKLSAAKQNIAHNLRNTNGIIYEDTPIYLQPQDITLNLLLHTATISDFYDRYNTLFHYLLESGSHTLYWVGRDITFSCYYKSSSISKFVFRQGMIWCQFSITLSVLGRYKDNIPV